MPDDFPLPGYDEGPMPEDQLLALADGLDLLPADVAERMALILGECRRARAAEAALQAGAVDSHSEREALVEDVAQIVLDAAEWLKTLWTVGYMGAREFPAEPRSAFPNIEVEDILNSALLARIRHGERPLPFPPPTRQGVPWHEVVESDAPFAVDASLVRDDDGTLVGAVVEACNDWRVVGEAADGIRVQHQGKGPIYRLQVADPPAASTLRREPPTWTRRILGQTRAGTTRYLLEWPRHDDAPRQVALRAATWERAEAEASYWIAANYPEMYGQVSFERVG